MATFDPRRLLMFAVRVLDDRWESAFQCAMKITSRNARKAGMRVGDLLREKQTVAGDGLSRIVIRYGESSRDPQAWEGSECHGNLIALQF